MFPSVDSSAITDVLHMMGKKMLIQDRQILQDDPLPHFFVSVFYFEKSMNEWATVVSIINIRISQVFVR